MFLCRSHSTIMVIAIALVSWAPRDSRCDESDSARITVAIRPSATVGDRVVTVQDIADLEAGDPRIIDRIADVDLADPPAEGEQIHLSQQQVNIRLMLAGFTQNELNVTGPPETAITRRAGITVNDASMLAAVRTALARELRKPPAALHLSLLRPIRLLDEHRLSNDVRLDVRFPANVETNSVTAKVGIYVNDRLREVTTVAVEVKVNQRTPVAQLDIEPGERLTRENVAYEVMPVAPQARLPKEELVFGKQARGKLLAGEMITHQDLMTPVLQSRPIVIRPRDHVTVVARRGSVVIHLQDAEALDAGRPGDTIRLKNRGSGRIFRGRISNTGQVHATF